MLVMVDIEANMVFAHVCKRKGADPDILETMMEDIEVSGHRTGHRKTRATKRIQSKQFNKTLQLGDQR